MSNAKMKGFSCSWAKGLCVCESDEEEAYSEWRQEISNLLNLRVHNTTRNKQTLLGGLDFQVALHWFTFLSEAKLHLCPVLKF